MPGSATHKLGAGSRIEPRKSSPRADVPPSRYLSAHGDLGSGEVTAEMLQRQPANAAEWAQGQILQDPSNAVAYAIQGMALCSLGCPAEGVRSLEWAHYLEPGSPSILHNFGIALEQCNRPEEARIRFYAALQLDPHHTYALERLARLPNGPPPLATGGELGVTAPPAPSLPAADMAAKFSSGLEVRRVPRWLSTWGAVACLGVGLLLIGGILTGFAGTNWQPIRVAAAEAPESPSALRGALLAGADLRDQVFDKADLRGAKLPRAVLLGCRFREAKMSGVDLMGANLRNADLQGADLTKAYLKVARMSGAGFQGANLNQANARHADLSWTDLRGASLRSAQLRDADLSHSDLRGADLSGADLSLCRLSGAQLESVRYNGRTRWPAGFDPRPSGGVLVESP